MTKALIAIGVFILAIVILVELIELAFGLVVLAIGIGLALVAFFAAEKLLGKGK